MESLHRLMQEIEVIETKQATITKQIEECMVVIIQSETVDVASLASSIQQLNNQEKALEEEWAIKRQSMLKMKQQLRSQIVSDPANIRSWNEESVRLAFSSKKVSPPSSESAHSTTTATNSNDHGTSIAQSILGAEESPAWELQPEEIDTKNAKLLGAGAFGSVYKTVLRGKEVAIKILQQQKLEEKVIEDFKREVRVMVKLRHPHLLLFMGACTTPGHLAIVTELMPRGSVFDLLQGQQKVNLSFRRTILFALDTAQGMNWLHCMQPPILHLDLKPHNLLVDSNWVVKVSDFGLSTVKKATNTGQAGSPLYMAPEMLINRPFDEKADIYSFGIVLWELITRKEPFEGQFTTFNQLVQAVTKDHVRPKIPDSCPTVVRNLITSCWSPHPKDRPSFSDILASRALETAIIEGVIGQSNDVGRKFWSQHFMGRWTIPYAEFLAAFMTFLGLSFGQYPREDLRWQCIKAVLLKDKEETVTIDEFGKFLEWFGPLERGKQIVECVYSICISLKGFFGDMSSEEASKLLSGKDKGTYIVRFSLSEPGCFALTVVNKMKQLQQFKILHRAGSAYTLLNYKAWTLGELLKTVSKEMKLKRPAEGSKFEQMETAFIKKTPTLANYSAQM